MFRQKDARVGPPEPEPLQVGLIQMPRMHTSEKLAYRLHNCSGEPVADISTLVDVESFRDPVMRSRVPGLQSARLRPGEIRDVDVELGRLRLGTNGASLQESQNHGDSWLNVTLVVRYRTEDGFIKEVSTRASIDGR